jgi:hypothetical protein
MNEYRLYGDSRLPPELETRVQSELSDGERLLWVGQPLPGRIARSAIPIVLFGIPWTAFSIFWVAAASGMVFLGFGKGDAGVGGIGAIFSCFPLFGIPFILIGFGMLSSPYWLRRRAKRTCYALTERRAIIWQGGWFGSVEVRSYGPSELNKIRRTEYSDGSGDLVFEEVVSIGRYNNGQRTTHTTRHGFMAIAEVRKIDELLRKALLSDRHQDGPNR